SPNDGKPECRYNRCNDRNRCNQFPYRPSTRDTTDEHRHHRPITNEPSKEEYCPPTKPSCITTVGAHRDEILYIHPTLLQIQIKNKQPWTNYENGCHKQQRQDYIIGTQNLNPFMNPSSRRNCRRYDDDSNDNALNLYIIRNSK